MGAASRKEEVRLAAKNYYEALGVGKQASISRRLKKPIKSSPKSGILMLINLLERI